MSRVEPGVIDAAIDLLIAGASARSVSASLGISRERARALMRDPRVVEAKEAKARKSRELSRRIAYQTGGTYGTPGEPAPKPLPKTSDLFSGALSIPLRSDPATWRELGERYPLTGVLTAEQSGVLFERVAFGIPVPIAAVRCGCEEGDPAVWTSRARQGEEPFSSFCQALSMAAANAIEWLVDRVRDGGMGWQGAAKLLQALRPDIFAVKDSRDEVSVSSIDGLEAEKLVALVEDQIAAFRGRKARPKPSKKVVVPLRVTGVDDEADDAR